MKQFCDQIKPSALPRGRWRGIFSMAGVASVLATVWAANTTCFARHRVCLEGYRFIENGMTRADVERILRGVPGYYATGEVVPAWPRIMVRGQEVATWLDDGGVVMVGFDFDGRVIDKEFVPVIPVESRSWSLKGLWNRYIYLRKMRTVKVTGGIVGRPYSGKLVESRSGAVG